MKNPECPNCGSTKVMVTCSCLKCGGEQWSPDSSVDWNELENAVHEYVHLSPAHAKQFGYELVTVDFEQKINPDTEKLERVPLYR